MGEDLAYLLLFDKKVRGSWKQSLSQPSVSLFFPSVAHILRPFTPTLYLPFLGKAPRSKRT